MKFQEAPAAVEVGVVNRCGVMRDDVRTVPLSWDNAAMLQQTETFNTIVCASDFVVTVWGRPTSGCDSQGCTYF